MSKVADAPINLSDLVVSRASGFPFCASQAAYGISQFDDQGWSMWVGAQRHMELLVLHAPAEVVSASWFDASVDGIFRALGLSRGWDTYEARSVARTSTQSALSFMARFFEPTTAPPTVVPLADGGIQLEWHRGGLDVEIAFSPDEVPEMYVADHETGESWDFDPASVQFEEIRPLLDRLRAE